MSEETPQTEESESDIRKEWFVIHALSGHEKKVRLNMQKRLQLEEVDEYIGEILIPTETVQEIKNGQKREVVRKLHPGYVYIQMKLYDDENSLFGKTFHFVKNTPSVIGFVGGDNPMPLLQDEVNQLLHQIEEKSEKVMPSIEFEVEEVVKINDGPFMNFNGKITNIDPEHGRLKVIVTIFGRETPVDLEYWQVEKIT